MTRQIPMPRPHTFGFASDESTSLSSRSPPFSIDQSSDVCAFFLLVGVLVALSLFFVGQSSSSSQFHRYTPPKPDMLFDLVLDMDAFRAEIAPFPLSIADLELQEWREINCCIGTQFRLTDEDLSQFVEHDMYGRTLRVWVTHFVAVVCQDREIFTNDDGWN